jgi:hypothetical protein
MTWSSADQIVHVSLIIPLGIFSGIPGRTFYCKDTWEMASLVLVGDHPTLLQQPRLFLGPRPIRMAWFWECYLKRHEPQTLNQEGGRHCDAKIDKSVCSTGIEPDSHTDPRYFNSDYFCYRIYPYPKTVRSWSTLAMTPKKSTRRWRIWDIPW